MPSIGKGRAKTAELKRMSARTPRVAHSRPSVNLLKPQGRSAPKTSKPKTSGKEFPGS